MTGEPTIRRRRSLTNVGGEIDRSGDEDASLKLAHAIDVAPPEDQADAPDRDHVHGFHAYPARAHPVTARRLVEAFAPARGTVLDPFCGSGTVLVEAMLAGRDVIGTDLNPLGVMLARVKTYPRPPAKSAALVEAAKKVAAFADERRKKKAGATHRLPNEDVVLFAPHVLLELDSIRAGIAKEAPPEVRPELSLILSSILVKLSKKRGDTSVETVEKRISAGYPARLFVKKTEEAGRRMDELFGLLPSPHPRARVFADDATVLKKVDSASIDCVITSPPYVATYDYLAHHDVRMRWLGLDVAALEKGEIGSRRRYEKFSPPEAARVWREELGRLFDALARVTRPGGPIILLIADSATPAAKGQPAVALRADAIVAEVANAKGTLEPVARASQARPHFHAPTAAAFRDAARAEHAILLRRR